MPRSAAECPPAPTPRPGAAGIAETYATLNAGDHACFAAASALGTLAAIPQARAA